MPKPVTGSTKDYYVKPGTTTANKYGGSRNYSTGSNKFASSNSVQTNLPICI